MKKTTTKTTKNNDFFNHLMAWMQKDILFIIIALLVLAACFYTIRSVGSYQQRINDAWMQQWNESCSCKHLNTPVEINISFKLGGDYYAD